MLVKVNSLVVSDHVFDDDGIDEESLTQAEAELLLAKRELELKVAELRASANSLLSEIELFSGEMEELYPYEHTLLKQLQQELRELSERKWDLGEQVGFSLDELMKDSLMREHLERVKAHNESLSKKKNDKVKSAGVKRIFRKIAAKAHPDRTDKEYLHVIFKMAHEAYNDNDYGKLEKLWKCIVLKTTWAFMVLEEKVAELKVQEVLNARELNDIIQSDMFNMMKDARSKQPMLVLRARSFYHQKIQHQIEGVMNQLRMMDPQKYPEPEPQHIFISSMLIDPTSGGFFR